MSKKRESTTCSTGVWVERELELTVCVVKKWAWSLSVGIGNPLALVPTSEVSAGTQNHSLQRLLQQAPHTTPKITIRAPPL